MYLLSVRTSNFFELGMLAVTIPAVRLASLKFAALRVIVLGVVLLQMMAYIATNLMKSSLKVSAPMMLTLTTFTLMAWNLGYHDP